MKKNIWLALLMVADGTIVFLVWFLWQTAPPSLPINSAPIAADLVESTTTLTAVESASTSTPVSTTTLPVNIKPLPQTPPPLPPATIVPSLTGVLEEVNTGCFADGECYAVVAGVHVTLMRGWYQGPAGKIVGAESIGDLEQYIGSSVTVFAGQEEQGGLTLLGNEMFYLHVDTNISSTSTASGCVVSGCSSQLCVEAGSEPMASTCEWTEAYGCYQNATCSRNAAGQCGWVQTPALNMCLASAQS